MEVPVGEVHERRVGEDVGRVAVDLGARVLLVRVERGVGGVHDRVAARALVRVDVDDALEDRVHGGHHGICTRWRSAPSSPAEPAPLAIDVTLRSVIAVGPPTSVVLTSIPSRPCRRWTSSALRSVTVPLSRQAALPAPPASVTTRSSASVPWKSSAAPGSSPPARCRPGGSSTRCCRARAGTSRSRRSAAAAALRPRARRAAGRSRRSSCAGSQRCRSRPAQGSPRRRSPRRRSPPRSCTGVCAVVQSPVPAGAAKRCAARRDGRRRNSAEHADHGRAGQAPQHRSGSPESHSSFYHARHARRACIASRRARAAGARSAA